MLAIAEAINSNQIAAKEVLTDYNRILKEVRVNRVNPQMIGKVEKIVQPLDEAVHVDFGRAEDAQRDYFRVLEKARKDPTLAEAASRAARSADRQAGAWCCRGWVSCPTSTG